jgi:hypothetical protein
MSKALRREAPQIGWDKHQGGRHMNKMRSFRSDYVEDAFLITAVIIISLGLYLAAAYLVILF